MKLFNLFGSKTSTAAAFDKIQGYNTRGPRFSGRALYGGTCTLCMTRKDQMREGYVARTFHIPTDIDDELRMMAIKNHVRFSDMAISAFRDFIRGSKKNDGK